MLKIIVAVLIIILILTTTTGLHAKIERKVTNWLELSRLFFFLLLTASIVHTFLHFKTQLLSNLVWIIFLIIIYILMETAFRLKRETFGNPYLTALLFIALIIAFGFKLGEEIAIIGALAGRVKLFTGHTKTIIKNRKAPAWIYRH